MKHICGLFSTMFVSCASDSGGRISRARFSAASSLAVSSNAASSAGVACEKSSLEFPRLEETSPASGLSFSLRGEISLLPASISFTGRRKKVGPVPSARAVPSVFCERVTSAWSKDCRRPVRPSTEAGSFEPEGVRRGLGRSGDLEEWSGESVGMTGEAATTLVEGTGGDGIEGAAEVGGVEGETDSGETDAVRGVDAVSVTRLVACCSMLFRFSSSGNFARSSPTAIRRAGRELDELNDADRSDEETKLGSTCGEREKAWFGGGVKASDEGRVEGWDEGMADAKSVGRFRWRRVGENGVESTGKGRTKRMDRVTASSVLAEGVESVEEKVTRASARRRCPVRVKKSSWTVSPHASALDRRANPIKYSFSPSLTRWSSSRCCPCCTSPLKRSTAVNPSCPSSSSSSRLAVSLASVNESDSAADKARQGRPKAPTPNALACAVCSIACAASNASLRCSKELSRTRRRRAERTTATSL